MPIEVSVIVPTYDRPQDLEACLNSLALQSLGRDRFEVLVVDDGSPPSTAEVVQAARERTDLNLRYFRQANRGPAAARNLGVDQAATDLVAFTDDDCRPDVSWLAELLRALPDDGNCAGVGGETVRLRDTLTGRYIDEIGMLRPHIRGGPGDYLVTANALFRRGCLKAVGGFEPEFRWAGGEDVELSARLRSHGYRLIATRTALVRHNHRDRVNELYATFVRYGRGEAEQANLGRKRRFYHRWVGFYFLGCAGHWVLESARLCARPGLRFRDRLAFPWLRLISNAGIFTGYASHRRRFLRPAPSPG